MHGKPVPFTISPYTHTAAALQHRTVPVRRTFLIPGTDYCIEIVGINLAVEIDITGSAGRVKDILTADLQDRTIGVGRGKIVVAGGGDGDRAGPLDAEGIVG